MKRRLLPSAAMLGNPNVARGGDVMRWYLVATLQSQPRERQMYVTVLAPGEPPAISSHIIFIASGRE